MTKLLRLLFLGLLAFSVPSLLRADDPAPPIVLFYGDSLTAGYGLDDPTTSAFPALIQQKIDDAHLTYRVINAGLSGETSSGGVRRINWVLRQPVDTFILELGANDGLRGLPLETLRANLLEIFQRVRARNPHARLVLAGMRMPTSMGDYATAFDALYPQLAADTGATLIPFLLADVGGIPALNQADAIHPTAAGHQILAENIWRVLQTVLTVPATPTP